MDKLLDQFSVGLFFWQIILFLALLFLLRKYAWKPILTSVINREESIKEGLESAELAKKQMRQLKEDNKSLLAEARMERDLIVKEAREAKDNMISEAKDKAKEEGAKMIEAAKSAIQAERNAAVNQLKSQVAELSIQIAEKIIKSEISSNARQQEIISAAMQNAKLN
ncbi:MAG: F0F1 ATP synthase subunit B [Vicingaceae bacterium]|jgi:F-type H+-transporting ATPase subunit b|tara:strand:- start:1628 stop:2128 length:501 start_codon:yes stop_codon:yes gene_type:complete